MRKKEEDTCQYHAVSILISSDRMHIRGTKQEAETKVDYYIGVVDDNAPYYYEEDGLPKGYYADFVAAMAKRRTIYL